MNLDDVVAQLLAGSLNEFTNARNAKAKELKAAGRRELAAEVAGLKKPPVAVWAVNQLARRNASVLERLRRAGESVVQAQSGAVSGRKNAAPELRSASEALQRELEATVREAGDVLRAGDHDRPGPPAPPRRGSRRVKRGRRASRSAKRRRPRSGSRWNTCCARPRPTKRRRSRPRRPHAGCGKKPTGSRPMPGAPAKGRDRPRKNSSAPMLRRRCREKRRGESARGANVAGALRRRASLDGHPAGWLTHAIATRACSRSRPAQRVTGCERPLLRRQRRHLPPAIQPTP